MSEAEREQIERRAAGSRRPRRGAGRLIVRPRTVSAGEPTDFSVKTRVRHPEEAPIGFVRVRFAGQTFHTNQRGHARIEATFAHSGKRRARARLEGHKQAVAVVRVTP